MPAYNQSLFNAQIFGPGSLVSMKCRDLLYIAFREARVLLRPQARNSDNELMDGLIFLNQQIDYWAARSCYAWTTNFTAYTLTPNHQPHLIGPGLLAPDFDAAMRPVRIESASVILPGAPSTIDLGINIRDKDWWARNSLKANKSNIPTDLYYEPDVPNGQLWLAPIANAACGIRLEANVVLQRFSKLEDAFIAPQAYQAAVTLTLAEELSDVWGTTAPPNLARRALKARDALQSNNNLPPRIASADYGTFGSPSADFNYLTGTLPGRR